MIRFIADENFDGPTLAGLRRRHPHVEIRTIQELGMSGTPDPDILEWATQHDLVVLSRDRGSMVEFANDRLRRGQELSGLLLINDWMSRGTIIDQIEEWSRKDLESAFAHPIQYLRPH